VLINGWVFYRMACGQLTACKCRSLAHDGKTLSKVIMKSTQLHVLCLCLYLLSIPLSVRARAAEQDRATLKRAKTTPAIETLIGDLKAPDYGVRQIAVTWLVASKDPRAIEPLIAALKDADPEVRLLVAEALGDSKDLRAVSALLASLKMRDMDVIAGAMPFFIGRGEPGSEDALIEVLHKIEDKLAEGAAPTGGPPSRIMTGLELRAYRNEALMFGDKEMATYFLNCGNSKLEQAAREWAARHDYLIQQTPFDGGVVEWGKAAR
jgi:hypothetical protein